MIRRAVMIWLLLSAVWPAAARAAWMEASSPHFVIYANDSPRDLQRFSEQLEAYHAAMAFLTRHETPPPSPSNRVTVYVVGDEFEVRRLYGEGGKDLGGFYVPRAGGSLVIVPHLDPARGEAGFSTIALLHEYAHHFLIGGSSFPMPRWFSEGAAEFFASASFHSDGRISVGRPAMHRAGDLLFAHDVTVKELVDPDLYERRRSKSYDAFYGKSWLLYHFLTFEPSRNGQIPRYLSAMAEGKSSPEAARQAFGDLAQLEKDVDSYLGRSHLQVFMSKAAMPKSTAISLRALSAGEAEMMPIRIRSRRGVTREQAKELLFDARAVSARYPNDAAVLAALAEAEYDAGNEAEAIAAADRALAIDPGQINAYVQKGLAMFRQAARAKDAAAAYRMAIMPFVELNHRENDHPLPLIYFYRSFIDQGLAPSQRAMDGLARASELAPFDLGLRLTLAMQQLSQGNRAEARRNLLPIAYNPHGGALAERARIVVARIDGDPAWRGEGAFGAEPPGSGGTAGGK